MKRFYAVLVCMAFICVNGCEQQVSQQSSSVDIEQIRTELTKAQYEYAQAWCNMDMEAISRIWSHDNDITLWGPAERDRVQGWDGVRTWYEAAMAPMAKVDFKIHDLLIKVSEDGNSAIVTYYVENDYVDKDGNAGKMTPRVTVVKMKQNVSIY